jgi:hypothetical protein
MPAGLSVPAAQAGRSGQPEPPATTANPATAPHPGDHGDPDAYPDCPAIPPRSLSKQATACRAAPSAYYAVRSWPPPARAIRDACPEREIVRVAKASRERSAARRVRRDPAGHASLALQDRRIRPHGRKVATAQNIRIWKTGILTVTQQTFTQNGGY